MELLRNMQYQLHATACFITNRSKRTYRSPTSDYLVTVEIRVRV